MTLLEMKKQVLKLIEEINPNSELLTDDPDIANKINEIINEKMLETFISSGSYLHIRAVSYEALVYRGFAAASGLRRLLGGFGFRRQRRLGQR